MKKSALILTNIYPKTNAAKSNFEIAGKHLINHVIDAVNPFVDEVVIVTDSEENAKLYSKIVKPKFQIIFDKNSTSFTSSFLTGLETIQGEYTIVLPSNSPFVSKDIISLLFELSIGKNAVIPRKPDMSAEPFFSVYNTEQLIAAIRTSLPQDQLDMYSVLDDLRGIRYISSIVFKQLDPDFKSFFTVNTPTDLKKAEAMLRLKPTKNRSKTNKNRKR